MVIALLALQCQAWTAPPPNFVDKRLEEALRLKERGQGSKAQALLLSLLASLESGPPSVELGRVLNSLSQVSSSQGEYEKSAIFARRARVIFHGAGDRASEAKAFNNAGVAELFKGDYGAASQDFTAFLELSRQLANHEAEVQARNNLGSVYLYQSRYQDALVSYQAANETLAKSEAEPWHSYWAKITLFNLATLYQRVGSFQRALETYKRLEQSPEGLSAGDRAHLYSNLGTIYRRLGDPGKALATYRRAKDLYARDRDSDGESGVLKNIGIVEALELGRLPDALRTFTAVLAAAEKAGNKREVLQAHVYRGEALLRINRIPDAAREFETALSGAVELGAAEDRWKALYGVGRTKEKAEDLAGAEQNYRDAMAQIESMRFKLEFASLRAGFLADKRDVYDALIHLLIGRNDVEGAFGVLERSRSRVFQERLRESNGQVTPVVSLHEVQDSLDHSNILLEYWLSSSELAVIWVTSDKSGVVTQPFTEQDFAQLSTSVQNLPESASNRENIAVFNELFPTGIATVAKDFRHLTVVPDGIISLVPFDVIETEHSNARLLESKDITYLPSAILLSPSFQARARRIRPPWQPQLLAFGDPIVRGNIDGFEGSPKAADKPLPHSGEEIADIAGMCSGKVRLFSGINDRKSAFQSSAPSNTPLLHVSTHAIADYERPELSRLLFSPSDSQAASDFLFLKELYATDLRGLDMAVLSACDTERATVIRGEGLQGFSRALLAAGSRSAVTTLWRVDDEATAEFMKQFYYFALQKDLSKSQALRMAKLKFLRSNSRLSEPRYWAAFVLNGDASQIRDQFISWRELILTALLSVLLLVALILLVFRKTLLQSHRYRGYDTSTSVRQQT